jgi:glycosyltransferase involved in cell wall biosynthesis
MSEQGRKQSMAEPTATPLVSVIIAAYNRADIISETIDSVLAQSYPNIELIVVDDESPDDTWEVLRSYGDRITAVQRKNGGYGAARNTGLQYARGEYIAWLDCDDIYDPDMTALQVGVLESRKDAVIVSTDYQAFDERGPRAGSVRTYYAAFTRIPGGADTIYETTETFDPATVPWVRGQRSGPLTLRRGRVLQHLLQGAFLHPPTVMMRRSALLEAGNLDETLPNSIEYPFWFRLAKLGEFAFIDSPLLRYRISPKQASGELNAPNLTRGILQVLKELPAREPEIVRASPALYRRRLAESHLHAARAHAEIDRGRALREAWNAARCGLITATTASIVARALLPAAAVRGIRRLRRLGAATS